MHGQGHCDVVKEGRDLARVDLPWPLGSCFAHTLGVPWFTQQQGLKGEVQAALANTFHILLSTYIMGKAFPQRSSKFWPLLIYFLFISLLASDVTN